MNERLTMDQINEQYPDEWVFLVDPISIDPQGVQSGIVRFHSKDCDEVERQMLALQPRPRRSALLFTGEIADDVVVVL